MELKQIQYSAIRIGIASPREIQLWAEQYPHSNRPTGEVIKPQTVHYKTLEPVQDGLFCQRVFGPVENFKCSCGTNGGYPFTRFCIICDVKFTSSDARRYRLGYIRLANPVVHVWYLKGRLDYVSILLDLSRKDVEGITYGTKTKAFFHPDGAKWIDRFQPVVPFMPLAEKEVFLSYFDLRFFLRYATNPSTLIALPAREPPTPKSKISPNVDLPFLKPKGEQQLKWELKREAEKHRFLKKRAQTLRARLPDQRQAVKGFLIEHYQKVAVQNPCLDPIEVKHGKFTVGVSDGKVFEVAAQKPCSAPTRVSYGKVLEVAVQKPCSAPTELSSFDTVAQHYRSVINLDRVETAFPHQRFPIPNNPSPISHIDQIEVFVNPGWRYCLLGPPECFCSHTRGGWKYCLPGPLECFHTRYLYGFQELKKRLGLQLLPKQVQVAIRGKFQNNWRSRLRRRTRPTVWGEPRCNPTTNEVSPALLTKPALFGTKVIQRINILYANNVQPAALPQSRPLSAKLNVKAEYLIWVDSLPLLGRLKPVATQNKIKAESRNELFALMEKAVRGAEAKEMYGITLANKTHTFNIRRGSSALLLLLTYNIAIYCNQQGVKGITNLFGDQEAKSKNKSVSHTVLGSVKAGAAAKTSTRYATKTFVLFSSCAQPESSALSLGGCFDRGFFTLSVRSKRRRAANLLWYKRNQDQFPKQETGSVDPFHSFADSRVVKKLKTRRFRNRVLDCLGLKVSTKRSKGLNNSRFSVLNLLPSDRYSIYSTLISAARETRFLRKPRKDGLVSCKARHRFCLREHGWHTHVTPLNRNVPKFFLRKPNKYDFIWAYSNSRFSADIRPRPPQVKHGWHLRPVYKSEIGLEKSFRRVEIKVRGIDQHVVETVHKRARKSEVLPNVQRVFQALERFHCLLPTIRCDLVISGRRFRRKNPRCFCVYKPRPAAPGAEHVGHATKPFRSVKHLTLKKSHPCKPRLKRFWLDVESCYFTRNKSSHWPCKGEFCLLLTGPLLDNVTKPDKVNRKLNVARNKLKKVDKPLSRIKVASETRVELPSPLAGTGPTKPETGFGFDAFGLFCRKEEAEKQGQEAERKLSMDEIPYSLVVKKQKHKTSGLAIQEMLSKLDLKRAYKRLKVEEIPLLNRHIRLLESYQYLSKKERASFLRLIARRFTKARRLILIKNLCRSRIKPEWIALSNLPVLPPYLRPIIELDSEQVVVSDLNSLYQKVLFRNKRCLEWELQGLSVYFATFAQRLLQQAVDALIENGKGGSTPSLALSGRPLKSLSNVLKGKKGRFRLNLLGKRVDYSGRSVIVVGPTLKLQECGLPLEMALILFQPFLIRQLIVKKLSFTILQAKQLIQMFERVFSKTSKKPAPLEATFRFVKPRNRQLSLLTKHVPIGNELSPTVQSVIWEILHQTMRDHPVLLNRAPTLHRLGVQAFQPKLVDGSAILLHPLVCPAFNADFDGDQMAVHVPLSLEARAEAWNIMWARNNLLSPATGQPILVPSQDMVLGCYYLTALRNKPSDSQEGMPSGTALVPTAKPEGHLALKVKPAPSQQNRFYPAPGFSSFTDALKAYYQSKLKLHTPVWVRASGALECERGFEDPLEARISLSGTYDLLFPTYQYQYSYHTKRRVSSQYVRTTPGRILLNSAISEASSSTNVYNPSRVKQRS